MGGGRAVRGIVPGGVVIVVIVVAVVVRVVFVLTVGRLFIGWVGSSGGIIVGWWWTVVGVIITVTPRVQVFCPEVCESIKGPVGCGVRFGVSPVGHGADPFFQRVSNKWAAQGG